MPAPTFNRAKLPQGPDMADSFGPGRCRWPGACRLERPRAVRRTRRLTVYVGPWSASPGRSRSNCRRSRRSRNACGQTGLAGSLPRGRPAVQQLPWPACRWSSKSVAAGTSSTSPRARGRRAVRRPAGRAELGDRKVRAQIHLPAGPAGASRITPDRRRRQQHQFPGLRPPWPGAACRNRRRRRARSAPHPVPRHRRRSVARGRPAPLPGRRPQAARADRLGDPSIGGGGAYVPSRWPRRLRSARLPSRGNRPTRRSSRRSSPSTRQTDRPSSTTIPT